MNDPLCIAQFLIFLYNLQKLITINFKSNLIDEYLFLKKKYQCLILLIKEFFKFYVLAVIFKL